MDADRLARLTDKQRQCLRLVYAHLTSKEIAPLLGIEPNSVDQHIKAAMRALGAADRRGAARMLAEYEGLADRTLALREDQTSFEVLKPKVGPKWRLPLPARGDKPTDLKPLYRLAWILALMVLMAFAFGVFLAGLEALTRLGRAIGH